LPCDNGKGSSPATAAAAATLSPVEQNRYRGFRLPQHHQAYIGVQLLEQEYTTMTRNRSKFPETRTMTQLPLTMQRAVLSAASFYGFHLPEDGREVSVSLFPISVPALHVFVARPHRTLALIIGDAAVGVHFFSGTGVNYGMEQALYVAQHLDVQAPKAFNTQNFSQLMRDYGHKAYDMGKTLILSHVAFDQCMHADRQTLQQHEAQTSFHFEGLDQREACLVANKTF